MVARHPAALALTVLVAASGCYQSHSEVDARATGEHDAAGLRDGGPRRDAREPSPPDAGPDPEVELPPTGTRVVELVAGSAHVCARTDAGSVYCWGDNRVGQCAAGSRPQQLVPSRVRIPPAAHLGSWGDHTCAVGRDGSLQCWGFGAYGQLGVSARDLPACGRSDCSRRPLDVDTHTLDRVFAANHGTCSRGVDGRMECWGNDAAIRATPTEALFGWAKIDFGLRHGCALERVGGTVRCFARAGEDSAFGVLGDGGRGDGVVDVDDVVDVEVGYSHGCTLDAEGEVLCWGHDWAGALGRPKYEIEYCRYSDLGGDCAETPTAPVGLPLAVALSVGHSRTCTIDELGAVWCWGAWTDDGGGTSWCGETPADCEAFATRVPELEDAVIVETGSSLACAVDATSAVWCWGYGTYGLGDGETHPRVVDEPVRVAGFGPPSD